MPDAAQIREEAYRLLATTEHYCHMARLHLEIADDAGAFYDLTSAREHFCLAIREFQSLRAGFVERVSRGAHPA